MSCLFISKSLKDKSNSKAACRCTRHHMIFFSQVTHKSIWRLSVLAGKSFTTHLWDCWCCTLKYQKEVDAYLMCVRVSVLSRVDNIVERRWSLIELHPSFHGEAKMMIPTKYITHINRDCYVPIQHQGKGK